MSNSPFLNSIRTDMRQKGYALKTEKTVSVNGAPY